MESWRSVRSGDGVVVPRSRSAFPPVLDHAADVTGSTWTIQPPDLKHASEATRVHAPYDALRPENPRKILPRRVDQDCTPTSASQLSRYSQSGQNFSFHSTPLSHLDCWPGINSAPKCERCPSPADRYSRPLKDQRADSAPIAERRMRSRFIRVHHSW